MVIIDKQPPSSGNSYRHSVRPLLANGTLAYGPLVEDQRSRVVSAQLIDVGTVTLAIALSEPTIDTTALPVRVVLIDLRTDKQIATLDEPQPGSRFAACIEPIGDCDNDGVRDVAISAPWESTQGRTGSVYVYSGQNWGLLYKITSTSLATPDAIEGLGTCIKSIGDINGDNIEDLAVASSGTARGERTPELMSSYAQVALCDGRTGALVRSLPIPDDQDAVFGFGDSIESVGDVDGDKMPDLAIGHSGAFDENQRSVGCIYVISGRTFKPLDTLWGCEVDGDFGGDIEAVVAHDTITLVARSLNECVCFDIRAGYHKVRWRMPLRY